MRYKLLLPDSDSNLRAQARQSLRRVRKEQEGQGLQWRKDEVYQVVTVDGPWSYNDGFHPLQELLVEQSKYLFLEQLQLTIYDSVVPWSRSAPKRDLYDYAYGELHVMESIESYQKLMALGTMVWCDRDRREIQISISPLEGTKEEFMHVVTNLLFSLMRVIELTRKARGVIMAHRTHLRKPVSRQAEGYLTRMTKSLFEEIGALI